MKGVNEFLNDYLPGDVCGCGGDIELAIDVILDKEST